MTSTVSQRFAGYNSNGSGRDCYISNNNGGLHKTIQRDLAQINPSYETGSMARKLRFQGGAQQNSNKLIKYVPNGSGRDTYVYFDAVGQHTPGRQRYNYRTYPLKKAISQSDIFTVNQNKLTPQQKYMQETLRFFQQEKSRQLSQPKIKKSKYKSSDFKLPEIQSKYSSKVLNTQSLPQSTRFSSNELKSGMSPLQNGEVYEHYQQRVLTDLL